MGAYLNAEPSQKHMDNHKAYVQAWIQGIREKPEALVRAIRDAQNAAGYMEWKAELIPEQEYLKRKGKTLVQSHNTHKQPCNTAQHNGQEF